MRCLGFGLKGMKPPEMIDYPALPELAFITMSNHFNSRYRLVNAFFQAFSKTRYSQFFAGFQNRVLTEGFHERFMPIHRMVHVNIPRIH